MTVRIDISMTSPFKSITCSCIIHVFHRAAERSGIWKDMVSMCSLFDQLIAEGKPLDALTKRL